MSEFAERVTKAIENHQADLDKFGISRSAVERHVRAAGFEAACQPPQAEFTELRRGVLRDNYQEALDMTEADLAAFKVWLGQEDGLHGPRDQILAKIIADELKIGALRAAIADRSAKAVREAEQAKAESYAKRPLTARIAELEEMVKRLEAQTNAR
jgi:hypothetical protein